jgi:hypothetical protein
MTRCLLVSFHREMNNWPWTMSVRGLRKEKYPSPAAGECVCAIFRSAIFKTLVCIFAVGSESELHSSCQ